MDLNKEAEKATNTTFAVLALFIKLITGIALFSFFLAKSAKAKKMLRNQYLLGNVYELTEQKVATDIQKKEDWYFKIIWKLFHGLSAGWASAVSAVLTVLLVNITSSILFGMVIYNESVMAFITLLNWPLLLYIFFHYKPKFRYTPRQ